MIERNLMTVLSIRQKTLSWLAQQTGIAPKTLRRFGESQTQSINFRVLEQICMALECQPGDLLYRPMNAQRSAAVPTDNVVRIEMGG